MKSRQKEHLMFLVVIAFYIITGYLGWYNINQLIFWPIFAAPMGIFLIRTGQKEITGLTGILLSVIISFIATASFDPTTVIIFLIFILAPAFAYGTLYDKGLEIPRIIIITTLVAFLGWIIFLTCAKLMGTDYLESYFTALDTSQSIWNYYLLDDKIQSLLVDEQGKQMTTLYIEVMAQAVRMAKRTYPATIFTMSLLGSTVYILLLQFIARIYSWHRPAMKGILNVGLSPIASWILIILWMATSQAGSIDTIWTFTAESMLSILLVLFQLIGFITVIVMIMRMGTSKVISIIVGIISMMWLIFNPTLLIAIGCMDSMFNFRKVKTLI